MQHCALYQAGHCRSCQWLATPYTEQLQRKQQHLSALLAQHPVIDWLPVVSGAQQGFRHKAKMVVSGSVERPLLGMLPREGTAVDLCDCPLYPAEFAAIFAQLKIFIARAGLTPYNVGRKRGELKYILLTQSQHNGELMLRFVLRSENKLVQLQRALPWLQQQVPALRVISANIQPIHMAILEGDKEIYFSKQQALAEQFNQIPLYIRPQSFFQTNPQIAARLYATARDWVQALPVQNMWDLFCGVGGFALHCARVDRQVTGIEISAEAIACAQRSVQQLGLTQIEFAALDSTRFATHKNAVPDLVLVNPPRRGIGTQLCDYLQKMSPNYLLYSSCNAQTMAQDIARLPDYRIAKVQLFDMFPHTAHYEVLVLLVHTDNEEDRD